MIFGHRNFWLLFRILKLIYFPTTTNKETYVAGRGGRSEIVFLAILDSKFELYFSSARSYEFLVRRWLKVSTCFFCMSYPSAPCPISSDHRTTGPTSTTGVWEACTKRRGASNMNIHYDVTGLLTVVWRAREEEGSELIAHT